MLEAIRKKPAAVATSHRLWVMNALLAHHHMQNIIQALELNTHEGELKDETAVSVARQAGEFLMNKAITAHRDILTLAKARTKGVKTFDQLLGYDPFPEAYHIEAVDTPTGQKIRLYSEENRCVLQIKDKTASTPRRRFS